MTDNEIIKALRCCIWDDCNGCPAIDEEDCIRYTKESCVDLINRQKAEIERLEKENDSKIVRCIANYIRKAKSEAIKEFAERLCNGRASNDQVVIAVKVELEMMEAEK